MLKTQNFFNRKSSDINRNALASYDYTIDDNLKFSRSNLGTIEPNMVSLNQTSPLKFNFNQQQRNIQMKSYENQPKLLSMNMTRYRNVVQRINASAEFNVSKSTTPKRSQNGMASQSFKNDANSRESSLSPSCRISQSSKFNRVSINNKIMRKAVRNIQSNSF